MASGRQSVALNWFINYFCPKAARCLRYIHTIDFDAVDLLSTRRAKLFDGLISLLKY